MHLEFKSGKKHTHTHTHENNSPISHIQNQFAIVQLLLERRKKLCKIVKKTEAKLFHFANVGRYVRSALHMIISIIFLFFDSECSTQ